MIKPNYYITSSWDDGSKHDLKMADLLAKYDIPATFYIAHKGIRGDILYPQNIQKLSKRFEIGSHTLKHLHLTKISLKEAEKEILEGKSALENLIGKEVISFCYPWGGYNAKVKQLVGLSGFSYARTTKAFATSVLDRLAAPITIHAYDEYLPYHLFHGHRILYRKLFYYALRKKGLNFRWDDLAILFLDYCRKNGGAFHLYGHSWEIDKHNLWSRLERVLKYMNDNTPKAQRFTNGGLTTQADKHKEHYYGTIDPQQFETEFQTPYYIKELRIINNIVKNYDRTDANILDAGCGTGRISGLFTKANYTGVDYSKNFIDFAGKKYRAANRKFINSNFEKDVNIYSNKYDLIVLWGFIDRQTNPLGVIATLKPMVKKGTRIVFTIHNENNPFFRVIKKIRNEYFYNPYSITAFDLTTLEPHFNKFCAANGYKYEVASLGLINPASKYIPYVPCGKLGNTLVFIFDKL